MRKGPALEENARPEEPHLRSCCPGKISKYQGKSTAFPCSYLVACDHYIRGLGRAQVAGYLVLFRREDDHLIELAVSPGRTAKVRQHRDLSFS